ncbi:MAG: M81 family metallopeptidase [Clostridia bacterium]|nr:M81 family metallopeptidase [Clostridia bacterium]
MKILVGHWGHEANTFSESMANYESYTARGITFGEESIRAHEGVPSYLGGMIRACREEGIEMIPTCAYTAAAPVLDRNCTERMLDSILSVCRKRKDEIDGICLALHGAGVSELCDDLESFVLEKIREVVGEEIPITVPMDLHGNVSCRMAELANGLFGIKKYPHTDKAEASYLAAKTLARLVRGEIKTETAVLHLPLMIPISAGLTAREPFPEIEAYFDHYRAENGLLDASLFHGFPYADVADSTASVVVVSEKGAAAAARHLAEFVWDRRHYFKIKTPSVGEALDLAQAEERAGFVVINEMSDNPGGGCPGDGTHLLREMIRRDLPRSIFGYVVDPEAVEHLFRHRPGDRTDLILGGKHEAIFGSPLKLCDAEILCLSNGDFVHTSPNLLGQKTSLGRCARIRTGNVEIVVGSKRNQTFDDRPFAVTGADLSEYRYVGLKSTQHFRAYFSSRAAAVFSCDPPGLNCGDLSVFDYKKQTASVYPLEENVAFDPEI